MQPRLKFADSTFPFAEIELSITIIVIESVDELEQGPRCSISNGVRATCRV